MVTDRPTDGATVERPKKSYFSFVLENVKLPLSLKGRLKIVLAPILKNSLFFYQYYAFQIAIAAKCKI
jgi:hypothetical protein